MTRCIHFLSTWRHRANFRRYVPFSYRERRRNSYFESRLCELSDLSDMLKRLSDIWCVKHLKRNLLRRVSNHGLLARKITKRVFFHCTSRLRPSVSHVIVKKNLFWCFCLFIDWNLRGDISLSSLYSFFWPWTSFNIKYTIYDMLYVLSYIYDEA